MTPASDELVRVAVEQMPVGLAINEADGSFLFVNERLARINGSTVEAHEGATVADVVGDLAPQILRLYEQVLRTGEPIRHVHAGRLADADGPVRYFETNHLPVDLDGRRVVMTTVVEVTREHAARDEVARRAGQQASVAAVATAALAEVDLDHVLQAAVDALARDLRADSSAAIEVTAGGRFARVRAARGWDDMPGTRTAMEVEPNSEVAYVMSADRPVVVADYARETRFKPSQNQIERGVVSVVSVPVRVNGLAWGSLGVTATDEREFTHGDIQHLQSIAAVVGAAVARDLHREELVRTAGERRRLASAVLEAAEQERRRIAELLHDDLLQHLLYARQECEASGAAKQDAALARAAEALATATRQVRALIGEVHPVAVSHRGLQPAIQSLAAELAERGKVAVETDVQAESDGRYDSLAIGVVRELLTNVVRHAEASMARVRVARVDDDLVIAVSDDGKGMAARAAASAIDAGHVGLASVRERVGAVGGTMSFSHGLRGRGTGVVVQLPL